MNRPDAEIIALLKIALRNLTAVALPSEERDYAVEVLKEVGSSVPGLLSPTGRKPSQPEYQSFSPSSLPKWDCSGDSRPRPHSFYNKDRQPVDVYKSTAEQVFQQSYSAIRKADLLRRIEEVRTQSVLMVGRNLTLDDWMNREWVLREGNTLVSFAPATPANAAALVIAEQHCPTFGHLTVLEALTGPAAVERARQYAAKALAHDSH